MWTFRCYNDGDPQNLWQRWYSQTPDVHGSHTSAFNILEQRVQWQKPWTKVLDKKNKIVEVRLSDAAGVEWRILGFFGTARMEFVIVAVCSHKQKVYVPKDIKKTAIKRKKEIEQSIGKAPSCVRPR